MTMVNPERKILHEESVRAGAGVSNAILYSLAAMCNFLSMKHIETKRFTVNGNYSPPILAMLPFSAIDGIHIFENNSEISNVWIYSGKKGDAGSTMLDIKWKPAVDGAWASIFRPEGIPAFNIGASDFDGCSLNMVKEGFTAPVLEKSSFNAGDLIRMDLVGSMTGQPSGCGIIINYVPR